MQADGDKMDVPLEELLPRLELSEEAAGLLAGIARAPAALDRLVAGGFLVEAVKLVANALPKREAVWWACMCARHTGSDDKALVGIRQAAENWVRLQTDEARRAAFELAQAEGLQTPESWAAVGVFWAGESMAPASAPAVPPAPHLCGTAVAGSVNLSAVRGDPLRREARLKRFIDSAREIARGGSGRLAPEAGAAPEGPATHAKPSRDGAGGGTLA